MAKYVAQGRGVTLVTCTAGEMGEILVPELEHLAADKEDGLGEHRRGELDDAMKELGVTDHRFLGGFGKYRDSGMAWHDDGYAIPADDIHENAFWHADLREAADLLVEVIREVRPQVLVTYDEFGNYGHPDHIQAHRVATYAAALAAVPSYKPDLGEPWDIAKIYWSAMSESRFRATLRDCASRATPRRSRAWSPTATSVPGSPPTTRHQRAHRRRRRARDQARRARPAPQPGGAGRSVLPRRRERPVDVGRRVLPDREGPRAARSTTTGGSPTSSRASDTLRSGEPDRIASQRFLPLTGGPQRA